LYGLYFEWCVQFDISISLPMEVPLHNNPSSFAICVYHHGVRIAVTTTVNSCAYNIGFLPSNVIMHFYKMIVAKFGIE
jgi:hypothetical protein